MKLQSVFIRFYKSFNYHYTRKLERSDPSKRITTREWEFVGDKFYPHVEVPIDGEITTIVGANESGKSHLLSAIEAGIKGDSETSSIERTDFCRYSHFFRSVDDDVPRYPDFGFYWSDLTVHEKKRLKDLCKDKGPKREEDFKSFYFFRAKDKCTIYVPEETGSQVLVAVPIDAPPDDFLPPVFRIDSRIALPDRVSIHDLAKGRKDEGGRWTPFDRERAFRFAKSADDIEGLISAVSGAGTNGSGHVLVPESYQEKAEQLSIRLVSTATGPGDIDDKRAIKEFNLAYDLIFNIAGITVDDIEMLENALRDGKTGQVRSVLDKINHALSIKLRFPRIWSQDRNFALRVEATEHELSFLISDRTEREYSFDERSSGLQHFLSYYVQYLSHTTPEGVSNEILLMDEPDAFLSGEAQQDLLKIFQMFADPLSAGKGPDSIPIQVIYVTHSPFLIDKNHAERIRALEKPGGSKGTRVINKPAQNRYEPLRSALGAYVGETAFISQCNLMVEGPADQILLAGAATYLRRLGDVPESELLDLNRITIVPCGGASNVPYMVYLARGRDTEKPAVITLLDSDKDGNDAKRDLRKTGPHPGNRAVLPENFILQLGDIKAEEIGEIPGPKPPFKVLEDLIPPALAVQVTKEYLSELFGLSAEAVPNLTVEYLDANKGEDESFFGAIDKLVQAIEPAGSYHIDKVPFARTLIDILPALAKNRSDDPEKPIPELDQFEANMRTVFKRLRTIQTAAEGDVREKDMRRKVAEKVDTFLGDFRETGAARRDDVSRLLADIESDLNGNERESSFILQTSMRLKKDHALDEDPTELVASFEELVDGLESIKNADVMAARTPNPEVLRRSMKGKEPAGNSHAAGQSAKVRTVKNQKATPKPDEVEPAGADQRFQK